MGTEIIVAATGIISSILGFLASYIVQSLQRGWALDHQRREWRRSQLKLISERTSACVEEVSKLNWNKDLGKETFNKVVAEFIAKVDTSFDRELNHILAREWLPVINKILDDTEDKSAMLTKFREANIKFQSRINELIEETFR